MKKKVILIAAVSENGVIGKGNTLPWKLPDDMKYFAETTTGHAVVTGRKSYESIPPKYRPLPNRANIILSKMFTDIQGCFVYDNIEDAIKESSNHSDLCFIIGGAEIYNLALPYATHLYLTEIHGNVEGDVYFPNYDKSKFKETSRTPHPIDEKHKYAFDFVIYENI